MRLYRFNWTVRTILLAGVVSTSSVLAAVAQTPADNTKVNTRDRAQGAVTADQQKDNARDLEITQNIRRAVMDDKTLSTYAHNVKVVTKGGQVTLKGPVRSDAEKKSAITEPCHRPYTLFTFLLAPVLG